MKLPIPALMLVTEPTDRLEEIVDSAIAGGMNIVQLRDKTAEPTELLKTAKRLRAITAGRALLVVNGDAQIALGAGTDGAHLPEKGPSMASARRLLGNDALIGRSVHTVQSARRAEQEDADYLIAGTIFASNSHPGEPPAGLGFLHDICAAVSIPVLAIGGVTPENASDCLSAGAAGVAVLSPIMQASEPNVIARQYRDALDAVLGRSNLFGTSGTRNTNMIQLVVNGEEREFLQQMSISQLLMMYNLHERMVVIEHNGKIIPRSEYGDVILQAGDKLEIVQMMAGG